MRGDGRADNQLRAIQFTVGYNAWAEGSCLIDMGNTRVLVTATIEDRVPPFVRGTGQGWISAEYGMLPRATHDRTLREAARGKQQGRTVEIQRLIGRALRAAVNLKTLGERSILLDCDVLQADGGTRTASITAAYLALMQAVLKIHRITPFAVPPFKDWLSAVSVGLKEGHPLLDLNYEEDSHIDVDLNLVMTGRHQIVEIQGTGEHGWFNLDSLFDLIDVAQVGIDSIVAQQREAFPEGEILVAET